MRCIATSGSVGSHSMLMWFKSNGHVANWLRARRDAPAQGPGRGVTSPTRLLDSFCAAQKPWHWRVQRDVRITITRRAARATCARAASRYENKSRAKKSCLVSCYAHSAVFAGACSRQTRPGEFASFCSEINNGGSAARDVRSDCARGRRGAAQRICMRRPIPRGHASPPRPREA